MKMGMKAKIVAALVCAFALCVALAGCSGNGDGDNSGDASAAFQGDWVLSGGTSNGQDLDQATIDSMEQMGLYVYAQFNADGSLVLSMFGDQIDGTWTAKDATTADITIQNDTEEVKIVDGELTIEAEGNALRFKKGEIPAAAAPAADAATGDTAAAGDAAAADGAATDNVEGAEEATARDAEQSATPEA